MKKKKVYVKRRIILKVYNNLNIIFILGVLCILKLFRNLLYSSASVRIYLHIKCV